MHRDTDAATGTDALRTGSGDALRLVALLLCQRCIEGAGGECHTPGCSLWMNRAPDVPITPVADLKMEMSDA